MASRKESTTGKWQQGTFFLEATRSSQRSNALRIRKERKADRLREKRGQTSLLTYQEQSTLQHHCSTALHAFIVQSPPNHDVNDASLVVLHRLLATNSDVTAKALQELLLEQEENGGLARKLLAQLEGLLQRDSTVEAALTVLHEMTLALATANKLPTTGGNDGTGEVSYYGRAPLEWRNLFFPEYSSSSSFPADSSSSSAAAEPGDIITTLLKYSRSNLCFDTIGNVVLYAPDWAVRSIVPRHWPVLAEALPVAAYAVAALLRADSMHYGMDFIQAFLMMLGNNPLDDPRLFQTIDGLWIVQALSRREPACVEFLRQNELIVTSLRQCVASSTDANFLVPALQALTNLAVSCGEVLSHVHRRALIDAVPAAVACTSVEQWIPLFVDLLIEGQCSYPWKVEMVWAIADFCVPLATSSFWRDDLIDPLVDLMKQHETAEASIAIIDRALRVATTAEESMSRRTRFEAAGGVDLLEERAANGLRMAEQLVDDLFADDDVHDVHEAAFASSTQAPSSGRGRGRPIPAWMSNK